MAEHVDAVDSDRGAVVVLLREADNRDGDSTWGSKTASRKTRRSKVTGALATMTSAAGAARRVIFSVGGSLNMDESIPFGALLGGVERALATIAKVACILRARDVQ